MKDATTGATHAYGPIGAALGSFAGFVDRDTLRGIWSALMDSGSQEWVWMSEASSDEERTYHRNRWLETMSAADYAGLMLGLDVG